MGTGSFLGVRCCRGVTLTPHPLLVQRSKIEYRYTSTLPKGLRGLWKGETYLPTTAIAVARTLLNVTLYLPCLTCYSQNKKNVIIFSSNVSDDKKPSLTRKCETGRILKPNSISLGYSSVLRMLIQISFLYARGVGFESWSELRKSWGFCRLSSFTL